MDEHFLGQTGSWQSACHSAESASQHRLRPTKYGIRPMYLLLQSSFLAASKEGFFVTQPHAHVRNSPNRLTRRFDDGARRQCSLFPGTWLREHTNLLFGQQRHIGNLVRFPARCMRPRPPKRPTCGRVSAPTRSRNWRLEEVHTKL